MKAPAAVAAALFFAVGCSTTGKGFKNPELADYRTTYVAVLVTNGGDVGETLENKLVEKISRAGVKSIAATDIARFARSREDFETKMWSQGVQEVLYVNFGDAASSSTVGYQAWGTATTYGGTTTGTATAVPMMRFDREMAVQASLYNKQQEKVWTGRSKRKAQGLLFIRDGSMTSHSADGLIDAMRDSGILR